MKGAGGGVDVFAELRSNGVARVARALGLQSDGTHVWPCPACNVEHRGSEDARPPVNVVKDGGG